MGRFAIEVGGVQAAVQWDRPEFDEALAKLLLPHWRNRPDLSPQAVFCIEEDSAGALRVTGPAGSSRPPRADLVETLERRLHLYLASESRELVYVHAGVVEWRSSAVLVPGRSFGGKSVLVQALVERGARFLSDEYAVIDSDGRVSSFPRPVSLRVSGGVRRIEAADLGWVPRAEAFPVSAVFSVRFHRDAQWSVSPITAGQGVLELLDNTVSAEAAPSLALSYLARALAPARCWKGHRGEAKLAAERILDFVDATF